MLKHAFGDLSGGTLRGEGKTARGELRGATSEGKTARGKLRGATCEGDKRKARARSEERAGMQRGVPLLTLMRFGRNIRLARFCLDLVHCDACCSRPILQLKTSEKTEWNQGTRSDMPCWSLIKFAL